MNSRRGLSHAAIRFSGTPFSAHLRSSTTPPVRTQVFSFKDFPDYWSDIIRYSIWQDFKAATAMRQLLEDLLTEDLLTEDYSEDLLYRRLT